MNRIATDVLTKRGYGPGRQDYGFVEVRDGAHMFYWLYFTTATVESSCDRPLVIFLAGGPGTATSGHAFFSGLTPIDIDGNYRDSAWVNNFNLLLIDNPVGAGFSYVENPSLFTKTNNQIAKDLVTFLKGFYESHPEFRAVPLHIFGSSSGAKMAAEFALEIYNEIQNGEINCNLKSLAMISPWISPMDSIKSSAPFLFQTGVVDEDGYNKIMIEIESVEKLGTWAQVKKKREVIDDVSKGVDRFNLTIPTLDTSMHKRTKYDEYNSKLNHFMINEVTNFLEIQSKIEWGSQSPSVFRNLESEYFKPVTHIVENLLNNTDLKVAIINGQFDSITPIAGTLNWIGKMNWIGKRDYLKAPREAIIVNCVLEGYLKQGGNFSMFWINRAGHFLEKSNTAGMSFVLKKITSFESIGSSLMSWNQ